MHRILDQFIVFFPGFLRDLDCAPEGLSANSVKAVVDAHGDKAKTNCDGCFIPR